MHPDDKHCIVIGITLPPPKKRHAQTTHATCHSATRLATQLLNLPRHLKSYVDFSLQFPGGLRQRLDSARTLADSSFPPNRSVSQNT